MYKINLTDLFPKRETGYNIRNRNNSFFNCKTVTFKYSFSLFTIEAWYSLDPTIINSKSLELFKSKLLAFLGPVQRSIDRVFHPQVLNSTTLGKSHLKNTDLDIT